MRRIFAPAVLLAVSCLCPAASDSKLAPLPVPVSNNAVASLKVHGRSQIFSFMGIGPKKTWDVITNAAYALDLDTGKWSEARPVPGTAGRIAASAISAREQVFLFGGFVVDGQGGETTLPDLNVYEPVTEHWYRGEDIPVP